MMTLERNRRLGAQHSVQPQPTDPGRLKTHDIALATLPESLRDFATGIVKPAKRNYGGVGRAPT